MQLSQDQKSALILVGAIVVGGIVLGILSRNSFASLGPGVVTDQQSEGDEIPGSGGAGGNGGYTNYNTQPIVPQPLLPADTTGGDTAAQAGAGCCCTDNNPCFAGSPLDTGNTFSDLNSLLTYYQNTNPNYVALVQAQQKEYAGMFIAGSSYGTSTAFEGITG